MITAISEQVVKPVFVLTNLAPYAQRIHESWSYFGFIFQLFKGFLAIKNSTLISLSKKYFYKTIPGFSLKFTRPVKQFKLFNHSIEKLSRFFYKFKKKNGWLFFSIHFQFMKIGVFKLIKRPFFKTCLNLVLNLMKYKMKEWNYTKLGCFIISLLQKW